MLIITSTFVFSQSNNEKAVLQTLNEMAIALRSNNVNALDKLYADDYTSINQRGAIITKTTRLASIKSGHLKYEFFNYENMKVRFYDNTAIVNALIKAKIRGEDAVTVLATLTLTKNGENWQVVAAQATDIVK